MKTTVQLPGRIFTLLCFMVSLQLISCQRNKQQTQEKIMEDAIEKSTGEKTDAKIRDDKVTIEGKNYKAEINTKGGSWSGDIPKVVPKFDFGTINNTTVSEAEGAKTWGFIFKAVPLEAIGKYETLLKAKGFETVKMTMGKGTSLSGEKDKTIVSVIWSDEITHVSVQVRSGE